MMLLAYEYQDLLIDSAHEEEVVHILRTLDTDFITPGFDEQRRRLLARLEALGEMKILARLAEG